MAFNGIEYTLVKHERLDEFLKSDGLPDNAIAALLSFKPTLKFTKTGDSYTVTNSSPRGSKDTTFKSGVEFDDFAGPEKSPIKTTYTVEGNTITQIVKSSKGTVNFKNEFSGGELVVTITSARFDGVAKVYYKA